jgi:DNA-binding NtrC family response regulator
MADTEIYTILIVEDNAGLARLIQKQLERQGYRTQISSTGWQARDLIRETSEKILMLLDYQLGDVPATELLDQLEEMKIAVPFVVITGKGSEQVAVDMMKRGAKDYIIKTADLAQEIVPLVDKVIDELTREYKRKIYGTPDVHGRQV